MHAHHRQLCEGDRLLYDQRRKHALTGIKFAINERIRDQRETTFSALKFCKLFAEEVSKALNIIRIGQFT